MEIDCNYIHSIHPFGYNKLSGSSFIKSTTIKINYNSDSDIIEFISTKNDGIKYHMDSLERHIFQSKPNFMNIDNIFIIEYIKRIELQHKESLGKFKYKEEIEILKKDKDHYSNRIVKSNEEYLNEKKKIENKLKKIKTIRITKADYIDAINSKLPSNRCVSKNGRLDQYKKELDKFNITEEYIRDLKKENLNEMLETLKLENEEDILHLESKIQEITEDLERMDYWIKIYETIKNDRIFKKIMNELVFSKNWILNVINRYKLVCNDTNISFLLRNCGYSEIELDYGKCYISKMLEGNINLQYSSI
jgi:hypothetical protein